MKSKGINRLLQFIMGRTSMSETNVMATRPIAVEKPHLKPQTWTSWLCSLVDIEIFRRIGENLQVVLDEESGDHRSNYVCNHKAFGFSTFLLYQGFISLVDIFSPKLHLAEEGITSLTKQNSLISLNTGFLEKCCPYSASKACVWGFWQDLCRLHKPKKKKPSICSRCMDHCWRTLAL